MFRDIFRIRLIQKILDVLGAHGVLMILKIHNLCYISPLDNDSYVQFMTRNDAYGEYCHHTISFSKVLKNRYFDLIKLISQIVSLEQNTC